VPHTGLLNEQLKLKRSHFLSHMHVQLKMRRTDTQLIFKCFAKRISSTGS